MDLLAILKRSEGKTLEFKRDRPFRSPHSGMLMPTYKGNKGNLLQHWVLVELVELIRTGMSSAALLCFIDAHAMSPYASPSGQGDKVFGRAQSTLPGQRSLYEQSWLELRKNLRVDYPTSALFVRHLWPGGIKFVLCESDSRSVDDIAQWHQSFAHEVPMDLHFGDWRDRFRRGFSGGDGVCLVSFDPFMYDRNGPPRRPNPGNLYPPDLELIGEALRDLKSVPLVLQLSTYSANNSNSLPDVLESVENTLKSAGLKRYAAVRANGNMMSLVFTRDFAEIQDANLEQRFSDWLDRVPK